MGLFVVTHAHVRTMERECEACCGTSSLLPSLAGIECSRGCDACVFLHGELWQRSYSVHELLQGTFSIVVHFKRARCA